MIIWYFIVVKGTWTRDHFLKISLGDKRRPFLFDISYLIVIPCLFVMNVRFLHKKGVSPTLDVTGIIVQIHVHTIQKEDNSLREL